METFIVESVYKTKMFFFYKSQNISLLKDVEDSFDEYRVFFDQVLMKLKAKRED